jgi:SNF2 family DNA or RNA helicase
MKGEFIMVLVKHRLFGWMLKPYMVEKLNEEFYTITESVLAEGVEDKGYTNDQKELVKWSAQCSDKEISRVFSKKKVSTRDFFAKLTDENTITSIKEYIEKRLFKCFDIIRTADIRVFYKAESKNLFDEDEIEIVKGTTNAVFNFIKEPDASKYFLSISDGQNTINLTDTPGEILTSSPCILMADQRIYFFSKSDGIDGKKLLPFFTKSHILIPKTAEKKYFETFVRNAVENFQVKAEGFTIEASKPEPTTILSLENDWKNEFTLILKFDYAGKTISPNSKKKSFVSFIDKNGEYLFSKLERNLKFEGKKSEFMRRFTELEEANDCSYKIEKQLTDDLNLLNWVNANSILLSENEFVITQNFHGKKYFTQELSLDFNLKESKDWFDLKGTVTFGEYTIPFIALKNHLLRDIKEYLLPNGEVVILPDEWFEKYSGLFKLNKTEGETLKIKKHHLNYFYEELKEINKSLVEKVTGIVQLEPEKPTGLMAEFRPYQQKGYQWVYSLYKSKFGVCLADDMGLGKTIQTIAAILKIKDASNGNLVQTAQLDLFGQNTGSGTAKSSQSAGLIIMPTSLIHNWSNEIDKFAPALKYLKYTGTDRKKKSSGFDGYDVVLTSYGVARNDIDILQEYFYEFIILDESQAIKNPSSKIYQAVIGLNAKFKMVLTGTPIENSLLDLWTQLNFINPGLLGSQEFFKNEFAEPIERNRDNEEAKLKQRRLQKLISPFILRRTKLEVLDDLPDLTESVQYCEMHEQQLKLYSEEKAKIRNALLDSMEDEDVSKSNMIVIQGLTRLRQLANHPAMVAIEENVGNEFGSGKFDEVIRMLESLIAENHKVLLFSSFVKHLELFASHFEQQKWNYSKLIGSTTDREKQIKQFQEQEDCQLFLISLKAGGVGLNLTSADYVFFLDPWWNPAAENQALSRAHRIGQKNKVMAYRFITEDSIEEKILKLQDRKKELADVFINNNNPFKQLSKEDIVELFN